MPKQTTRSPAFRSPAPDSPRGTGPQEKIGGYLEVGTTGAGEVVLNLDRDRNGIGHLVFSPGQARNLAQILRKQAKLAAIQSPLNAGAEPGKGTQG